MGCHNNTTVKAIDQYSYVHARRQEAVDSNFC